MTEGLAATVLLRTGIYSGSADGGLKALRAISICVGLPYTFLICFMCLALWRGLQYECGDRKWKGNYFESELTDFGFTIYKALEGQEKMFNGAMGTIDGKKLLTSAIAIVCPVPTLFKACTELEAKKGKKGSRNFGIVVATTATFCFYLWLLLCFIDYAPVNEGAWLRGADLGNMTDPAGNTNYYQSRRYGYYRGWNMKVEENAKIIIPNNPMNKAQEVSNSMTPMEVGPRVGRNMRIEAIGWFFYFIFVTLLAYVRNMVRIAYKIPGGLIEDFLAATVVYPTVLFQISDQTSKEFPKDADDDTNRGEHLE